MVSKCQNKTKKRNGWTRKNVKTPKFDLEVKGQRRIGIMNLRDTLPHGDLFKHIFIMFKT